MASNTEMGVNEYEDIQIGDGTDQSVYEDIESDEKIDLKELALNLSKDYAAYFNIDTTNEAKALDDSIEDMLTHLEEYCNILEMIRSENTLCLEQMLKKVYDKSLIIEEIYAKIDKLQEFVTIVKQNVTVMEEEMNKAESLFNNNPVKKFFTSIISNTSSRRTNTSRRRPKYHHPNIFKTEDYIINGQIDNQSDNQPSSSDVANDEIINKNIVTQNDDNTIESVPIV